MSSSPDHLYLDLSIVNNDTTGEQQIPLNFRETRTNPILDNPSNYFMSVARFHVDTAGYSLPIFMPKLLLDGVNKDINKTAYSVSIAKVKEDATGITNLAQEYISWSPQDKTTQPPKEFYGNTVVNTNITLTMSQQQQIPTLPSNFTQYFFQSITQTPPNSLPSNPEAWDIVSSSTPLSINTKYTWFSKDWDKNGLSPYTYASETDKNLTWGSNGQNQYIKIGGGTFTSSVDGSTYNSSVIGDLQYLPTYDTVSDYDALNEYYSNITITASIDGINTYTGLKILPFDFNEKGSNAVNRNSLPQGTGFYPPPSPPDAQYITIFITDSEGYNPFPGIPTSLAYIEIYNTNLNQGNGTIEVLSEEHSSNASTTITFKNPVINDNQLGLWRTDGFSARQIPTTPPPDYFRWEILNIAFNPSLSTLNAQDYSTGYYTCFTPDWWISLVNKSIASVFNTSVTAETGVPVTQSPVLTLDPITNNITLLTPSTSWVDANDGNKTKYVNFAVSESLASGNILQIGGGVDKYVIFFNESLYSLFSSFNSARFGRKATTTYFDAPSQAVINGNPEGVGILAYQIILLNKNESNLSTLNGKNWYFNPTMYSPVPMWSPIQSIVFSTSLLPIQVSMTNPPQVYGSSIYDQTFKEEGGNNSQISTMISDVSVPLTSGNEYKPTITYAPSGEYRMIDLLGNSPVNQVGFAVAFKTKLGDVIPLRLGVGCGASVKLLFRRKRFNLGNVEPYDTN